MGNHLKNVTSNKPGSADFRRNRSLYEVAVFLFLILPSIALSLFAVRQGSVSFTTAATATILRDLGLVFLIVYFLACTGEPLRKIGWDFKAYRRELLVGLGLFLPVFFAASLVENALLQAGFTSPATPMPALHTSGSAFQTLLGLVLVSVVAFSEETIFRGYLMLRFREVTANSTLTVLLPTVIFAFGHGYEGSAGIGTVGFLGLVFALVYLWRGSLVAPMTMHFLQDFLGIVVVPLALK